MNKGIFYCYRIPTKIELTELDWLLKHPVQDEELTVAMGQEIWRVEYDARHPSMLRKNRLKNSQAYGFDGIVFEDDALGDSYTYESSGFGNEPEEYVEEETLIYYGQL